MYYKLTDKNMKTQGYFQWQLGEWYSIDEALRKSDAELCSPHWFHCYNHSLLAVIFNPMYANIEEPRLFRCNVKGMKQTDNGTKFGFTFMRLVEELPLPEINIIQKVAFGIIAAREVYSGDKWRKWAANWLSGKDRSYAAAVAAADAADAAAVAAADAADAAADAADAADYAAYAAYAAAYTAAVAAAYAAAYAAAVAAYAAADAVAYAAYAAANAAYAAANAAADDAAAKHLNLIAIVKEAMKVR